MFTPVEFFYINKSFDSENRGIFIQVDKSRYKLLIKATGKYTIEFVDEEKAEEFMDRIVCINELNRVDIVGNTIMINVVNSDVGVTLLCRDNKQLAVKLTKHLRKQYLLNHKKILKQIKEDIKNCKKEKIDEIDSIRF